MSCIKKQEAKNEARDSQERNALAKRKIDRRFYDFESYQDRRPAAVEPTKSEATTADQNK